MVLREIVGGKLLFLRMMKWMLFFMMFMGAVPVAGARSEDYSVATRIDSLDREIAAARRELDLLNSERHQFEVWGKGRYMNFGTMTMCRTENEMYPRQYCSFGLFANKGTSYLFPKAKGFGGFIKVGVDVRWVDVELVKYHSDNRDITFSGSTGAGKGVLSRYPSYLSMHYMNLTVGAFGVGPTVSIAPLAWVDKGISSLKLSLYVHYQPCYGLNVFRGVPYDTENRKMNLKHGGAVYESGFVSLVDFGARLQWHNFGLGVEGRRGAGRFNDSRYKWQNSDAFYVNGAGGRYRRKFAEARIYLSFRF